MKKKISLMASMVLYLIAIIILIYYFSLEFNELLRLSPTGRIVLLLLSCLIMYFGGLALTKYIDEKYKNKVLKINIGIWFILYIILLSTLTLFDDYFFRGDFNILNWNSELFKNYMSNSFNLIPFKTIFGYITKFISGDIAPYIFIYNIKFSKTFAQLFPDCHLSQSSHVTGSKACIFCRFLSLVFF